MIETMLGHYQITKQIGKGGMGEVYQAKDQKLGRNVAINALPEEFASDADLSVALSGSCGLMIPFFCGFASAPSCVHAAISV